MPFKFTGALAHLPRLLRGYIGYYNTARPCVMPNRFNADVNILAV
jgi:hypothetical protein